MRKENKMREFGEEERFYRVVKRLVRCAELLVRLLLKGISGQD